MEKKYLVVKNRKRVARVEADEIMYVLRDGRRLIVATMEGEYIYYDKMRSVECISGSEFYRLLDRCIVNMNYLKSVEVARRRLRFQNGDELFFGRDACSRMKVVFRDYLIKNQRELTDAFGSEEDACFAAEEEKGYKEASEGSSGDNALRVRQKGAFGGDM
ncbi:MAG: LytTR family transcriptional regulator DNA-binding domain-containing protein [Firmicutes bacterium]|nr:LytTR family transcriptional regulator DNA-binding domain-containing protein [Bacillota bacterium]